MPDPKPVVFISYSHRDEKWNDMLRPHLKMLSSVAEVDIWDDRRINAGADWFDEIRVAMNNAAAAVCLISAHYLTSDFCEKEEIPYLLERREKDGLLLIPLLIEPCAWDLSAWVKQIQMMPRDANPLSGLTGHKRKAVLADVTRILHSFIKDARQKPAPAQPGWQTLPKERVSIERLPQTGMALFGRKNEMKLLHEAWESEDTHIIVFTAYGGVGKSTLVNKWLETMGCENYRGAKRVYGWSFYSQGTSEKATSADLFINDALKWFGDETPEKGSPWEKGKRLAALVRKERSLLILDGLEPLQAYQAEELGKLQDPALAMLLTELARHHDGLCVITTRTHVADLRRFDKSVLARDLEIISVEAGRALLRMRGIRGTDCELEAAT